MKELLQSDYFWKSICILAFMLGLFIIVSHCIKVLRQGSFKQKHKPLSFYHGLTLDPKRHVVVIQWQQKEYLVMIGPSGDQVIDQRTLANPSQPSYEPTPLSKPYELTGHHAIS